MESAVNLTPEIESQTLAIPEQAKLITVTDNESMESANQFNLDIRQAIKDIEAWFDQIVKKAHEAHRALTAKKSETLKPLEDASAHVTGQVKAYLRKIREEEERQAAILRERARAEEEERRLAQAAEFEAEGNLDEANAILDEPLVYVAPAPVSNVPKVDGRLYRTQLKVRINSRIKFLTHVRPEVLIDCLSEAAWQTIEAGLSRKAKALGKAFKHEGCELYEA